jgi:hypothetical protein
MRTARLRDDDGTTMAEMLVGMTLMTVFMAMFTGVMITLYHVSSHAQSVATTAASLNIAFTKLDKTVRYASSISTPSATVNSANNYYVEFQSTHSGTNVCTQIQLNTVTKLLRQRTWVVPYSSLTGFAALASNVAANQPPFTSPNPAPFALLAHGDIDYEQLVISLNSTSGAPATSSGSAFTFTAVNSQNASKGAALDPTVPNSVCQEAGRP